MTQRYYRNQGTNSKYGNIRRRIDGHTFSSIKEAQRYSELNLMQKGGLISDLKLQVPFELQPAFTDRDGDKVQPIRYYADFTYYDQDGSYHIEDVKSSATKDNAVYRLKKKMMMYHGWYIEEV